MVRIFKDCNSTSLRVVLSAAAVAVRCSQNVEKFIATLAQSETIVIT